WASPRSTRLPASSSRLTSAAKPACPASTPPATSPRPSCPRSPRHRRRARWRVSSPSNRWWFEKTHMEFEHVTFDLPHGTFHALQGGDPDGQPTIVLHGFPDHPPTAKPFLAELGRRGRHVVAPWLRGYAPSPITGPFDFASLTSDVLALIDRWSPGRAVELIGHDWGALITYDACVTAPERIERAVTLAIPHPITFLSRLTRPAQLRRSWYMGLFQLPGSGWMVTARDLALIDHLWRQWSPSLSLDPALRAELHQDLRASMPAPIRYYREMLRPGMLAATRRLSQPITVPMLQLHGADDGCFL